MVISIKHAFERCQKESTYSCDPNTHSISHLTFNILLYKSRLMTKPAVWSVSSLSAWRKLGSLATHWAHSEDSDQTGQVPRLTWVLVERTVILLVLSWGGSLTWWFREVQNEPDHNKSNKLTCVPSEKSDQPGHPPSLIIFAVYFMGS